MRFVSFAARQQENRVDNKGAQEDNADIPVIKDGVSESRHRQEIRDVLVCADECSVGKENGQQEE